MVIGDLVRYKHNGKMGLLIKIDTNRPRADVIHEPDTHLVLWCERSGASTRQKWFVSPNWIEKA